MQTQTGRSFAMCSTSVNACWNRRARVIYNDCTVRDQNPVGEADPGAAMNLKVNLPPVPGGPGPPPPPPDGGGDDCHPSYPDKCLDPYAYDYDCLNGEGDGPLYVRGPLVVLPPDPFDLDRDGNGIGCEY
jgi:hypothetical protein